MQTTADCITLQSCSISLVECLPAMMLVGALLVTTPLLCLTLHIRSGRDSQRDRFAARYQQIEPRGT